MHAPWSVPKYRKKSIKMAILFNAYMSLTGFAILDMYPSAAWKKASNPWYAVNKGGTVIISSGSTMEIHGNVSGIPKPIFS
jgi:hypothetical protein